ncbi:ribosomal protein S18 acetylase RimI-like enzyme [Sporomusaceae bacterium BoRhaA]|uniref:GNAT family N-acetyltransferase n=1 Tax=Pelorhabdus rhamnosifermentans TaxID=2772457 RepID=UPI001C062757|nr:GNAT family N-acetyltransferase [Pelorhabdus rhamnosifermentans]MBU2699480.1 ribosomal protein S18 acetylase RimI-like enzyme [Pelorhabdus rhamnosifermentans]
MDIVIATKQDTVGIINMISECIKSMEAQGIYQWNKVYPNFEVIENDIKNGSGYVIKDNNKCIAYVAINEEQSLEYSQISWSTDVSKVLVIHRLSVHPESQGKCIAKKLMNFIEDFAVKHKYTCIRLDVYSGNRVALRLYEKMGYKSLGQVFFSWRELPFFCYEKVFATEV